MSINKKTFLAIVATILIVSLTVSWLFIELNNARIENQKALSEIDALLSIIKSLQQKHGVLNTTANVYITKQESPDITSTLYIGNILTDILEERLTGYCKGTYTDPTPLYYVSFGNATAGTSLTQLTTQYSRETGSTSSGIVSMDYYYNVTVTKMFTETVTINAVGLHWASSGDNNLGAVANFPSGYERFDNTWNCSVTWQLVFNLN